MKDSTLSSEIIEDIKRVASELNRDELSRSEYVQHGRFSVYKIYDGGHTWEEYCDAAGIKTRKKEPVSDEIYFARLKQAKHALGRLPKTNERKQFGLNFSKRRFPTLGAFIDKAISQGIIERQFTTDAELPQPVERSSTPLSGEPVSRSVSTSTQIKQEQAIPPIPKQTTRVKWERIDIDGFPYAPQEEAGVVALFAILCGKSYLKWQILDLRGGKGIDAICYDNETGKEIQVELKYILSRTSWHHSIEDIDYVVCWINRWHDFPKPVIELSRFIQSGVSQLL